MGMSAPRLGSALPHLHQDWAQPCRICPAWLSQDATTTNAIISLFDGDEAFAALAKVMPSRAAVDREWASGARACAQVLWGMPSIPLERD